MLMEWVQECSPIMKMQQCHQKSNNNNTTGLLETGSTGLLWGSNKIRCFLKDFNAYYYYYYPRSRMMPFVIDQTMNDN